MYRDGPPPHIIDGDTVLPGIGRVWWVARGLYPHGPYASGRGILEHWNPRSWTCMVGMQPGGLLH
jgi:hypothetical protein